MRVVKRDGSTESVSFDKVLARVCRECEADPARGLTALPAVDTTSLAQKVIAQLADMSLGDPL